MDTTNRVQIVTRILAVFGLIALLVLIGAGVSSVGNKNDGKGFFSSLFSAISLSRESLSVSTLPGEVSSGSQFVASWTHEKRSSNGGYDLMYACRTDAVLMLAGGAPIPCNSAFSLGDTSNIALIAQSSAPNPVVMEISVEFTPEGASKPSIASSASLVVSPHGSGTATTTPPATGAGGGGTGTGGGVTFGNTTTTVYPNSTRIDPNGLPDLVVEIVDVGVLVGSPTSTNQVFQHSNSVGINQQPAVVFDVKNAGTNISGNWKFRANLPTANGLFISESQSSLSPGNGVRFTLAFQESITNSGANPLTITLDQDNAIRESNESNNTATATVVRGY